MVIVKGLSDPPKSQVS